MNPVTSRQIRLYYCLEDYVSSISVPDLPSAQVWEPLPILSESLSAEYTHASYSHLSDYSDFSRQQLIDVSHQGGFSCYFKLDSFFLSALLSIIRSTTQLTTEEYSSFSAANAESDERFALLKVVQHESTVDYFVYRNCAVSQVSTSFEYGSFPISSFSFEAEVGQSYAGVDPNSLPASIASWVLKPEIFVDPTEEAEALQSVTFSSAGSAIDLISLNLDLSITRNLGVFDALSNLDYKKLIYSGTSEAIISGSFYYTDGSVIQSIASEEASSVSMVLKSGSSTLTLTLPATQAMGASHPTAESADTDVLFTASFSSVPNNGTEIQLSYTA